jgi:aminopeptidase-like protein
MLDGYLGYWRYKDLIENGALGFITYSGSVNYSDRDIDARELRSYVSEGVKILGVNLNVKDAVEIIKSGASQATVKIEQNEYEGKSRNVILELPGQCDKWIVFTAHYDSTSLSRGAYDNMSGCVGLLYAAQYFSENPHRYGLRFIFCGSEERGLLGSKAYCKDHESELENIDLNINLDMIGCTMGKFIACCTCENDAVSYIKYFGLEKAFQVAPYQDVYSSDSTPFADKGVPAISFARIAPKDTATIHDSYDTVEIIRASQMKEDCEFITAFAERMANAVYCPVSKTIPDNIKTKLDEYLCRKRKG